MYAFNVEQFTLIDNADHATEASDLGLKPGEWPREFEMVTGTGQVLYRSYFFTPHFVKYKSLDGGKVTIFND